MSRRFPDGIVPQPHNHAHRADMCIDAVADLDVDALYQLVTYFHATVNEIADAVAQTDRTADEIGAALDAWLAAGAGDRRLSTKIRGRLITTLTQPTLELT